MQLILTESVVDETKDIVDMCMFAFCYTGVCAVFASTCMFYKGLTKSHPVSLNWSQLVIVGIEVLSFGAQAIFYFFIDRMFDNLDAGGPVSENYF